MQYSPGLEHWLTPANLSLFDSHFVNYFSFSSSATSKKVETDAELSFNNQDFKSYCHKPHKDTFFVTPTNSTELMKIITKLNKSKSPGCDNIGPSLIKDVSTVIIDPLVYIFNLSLLSGCVPDKLKTC